MKLFTAGQIRKWDAFTIKQETIASLFLMERAATICYNWIVSNAILLPEKPIKIFCAKGNNGGDGLAIGRMLLKDGFKVNVYILEFGNIGTDDFQINLQKLHALTTDIAFIQSTDFFPEIDNEDIIIDAIFGTGLNKPIEGFTAYLIQHINKSAAKIISIDIPTGMLCDKSCKGLPVIKATDTLSFQQYKICFLMPENEAFVGNIHILDIGLDKNFENTEPTNFYLLDKASVQKIYTPRKTFAHKGNFGHALLIAGSNGKTGAAVLAAKACLRSGLGLLTTHIPAESYIIMQTAVPEAMVITDEKIDHKKYNSIGIGPGLGTTEASKNIVIEVIKKTGNSKLVIDADALNILSTQQDLLLQLPPQTILTPHPKEFERLFGVSNNDFERIEKALRKATQFNCYIILKGHHTFIATPDGKGYFNNTGNAGMAKGGSGDVLTGILTALAAQNYTPEETCLLGVYLHGMAGDIAAEKLSQEAMIATDIIECLGDTFKSFK